MNKKIFSIVISLIVISIGCISSAHEFKKITKSIDINRNITLDISADINTIKTPSRYTYLTQPYVNITHPENGTIINYPDLYIYGYSIDQTSMDYWQVTWESNTGSDTSFQYISPPSTYVTFRVGLHMIPDGWNKVTVTFCNIDDICGSDTILFYKISDVNDPPNIPTKPSGSNMGAIGDTLNFTTMSSDPNGDNIRFGWDWNSDDIVDEWTKYYPSGEICDISHIWLTSGIYNIKVKAEDQNGAKSSYSPIHQIIISDNTPPNKPNITGPSSGKPGISYSYAAYTNDPDGDKIFYKIDWDDGNNTGWVGPYNSGQVYIASHIWSAKGSYSIKVQAKDENDAESVWSNPMIITMPKNIKNQNYLLNILYEKLNNYSILISLIKNLNIFRMI